MVPVDLIEILGRNAEELAALVGALGGSPLIA